MILRVRSSRGTWRVSGLAAGDSVASLKARVALERGVPVVDQFLARDPAGKKTLVAYPTPSVIAALDADITLGDLGLSNGDLIYLIFPEGRDGPNPSPNP
eukprot:CAMPEP_0118867252 /NCGR_PEP_ID=MMETSP1163-20130328/10921_1 /TAXON_ID=124430 /ORGANISM="Phaeomonas parva, Strain CCMP2877" /LENGTH=99 /DNA_ID=CAMNT_0006801649 /DNA_START=41 /DNA_END=337 /DNA_ORIENTATION=-